MIQIVYLHGMNSVQSFEKFIEIRIKIFKTFVEDKNFIFQFQCEKACSFFVIWVKIKLFSDGNKKCIKDIRQSEYFLFKLENRYKSQSLM